MQALHLGDIVKSGREGDTREAMRNRSLVRSRAACFPRPNRAFSHDVTAAILVFPNNGTAAKLVCQDNLVGVERFSYVKTFFCSNKLA